MLPCGGCLVTWPEAEDATRDDIVLRGANAATRPAVEGVENTELFVTMFAFLTVTGIPCEDETASLCSVVQTFTHGGDKSKDEDRLSWTVGKISKELDLCGAARKLAPRVAAPLWV